MASNFFILSLAFLWLTACSSAPILSIEINADGIARDNYPLVIPVNIALPADGTYHLVNEASEKSFPVQVLPSGDLLAFIDSMSGDTKAVFGLRQSTGAKANTMKINQTTQGVEIFSGQQPIFTYQTEMAYPPKGLPDYYKRNGMIHPLYSPDGQILTDAFPVGHTHQHAIFNAWVNTLFKGEKVDFWNQHQGTGTVEHVSLDVAEAGNSAAVIESLLSHLSLKHGEVLQEKWSIRVYPTKDYFLFDLLSEQTNTSNDTLFIQDYHYGGMGFRGSKEWNSVDSTHYTNSWNILTSEGFTNEEANHTHASWVTSYGEIEGETAGVTVFGFPENFRYPQAIRVHPTMPYWVYAPMVDGAFFIAPGSLYKSKFRYYVHQGQPDQQVIQKIEKNLKSPIKVKILD